MARKKSENNDGLDMDDIFNSLAKETGGSILSDIETCPYFFDTGNLAINYSCSGKFIGGGLPGAKIIEGYGGEASGKSLLGSSLLYSCQKMGGWANLIDCENASNTEFMEKISHLNLKRVIRHTPSTLEKAFQTIHSVTKAIREREVNLKLDRKPILFVFDSLTVPPLERELKENDLPVDYSVADWKKIVGRREQPGERGKFYSSALRRLQAMIIKEDVTVYLINQTRDKIGILYGNPETPAGGSNSLKFYASLRFRTAAKKKIEHKTLEKFAGINMEIKNVKNRLFRPFVVASDIKLFFESGIDPISGVLNLLIESERIIPGKVGNYEVASNYLPDGVDNYKFKASKTENRVDKKVLIDCPKLIDANSSEEVLEYLQDWSSGMDAFESGEYGEKEIAIDSDGEIEVLGNEEN